MKTLSYKKPIYIGVLAGLMAARIDQEMHGEKMAARSARTRREIGEAMLGRDLEVLRVGQVNMIACDGEVIPDTAERVGRAKLIWVGSDGSAVLARCE